MTLFRKNLDYYSSSLSKFFESTRYSSISTVFLKSPPKLLHALVERSMAEQARSVSMEG
jgi:hypothetical protein